MKKISFIGLITFDVCFTSFSGNDYYYNLSLNRN